MTCKDMCAQSLATFGMGAHFCLGYPLYMQVTHKPPLVVLCVQTEEGVLAAAGKYMEC